MNPVRSARLLLVAILVSCDEPEAPLNPVPALTGISPPTADLGFISQVVELSGSNFVASSVAEVGGSPRFTRFVNPLTLRVTLTTEDLATRGDLMVSVSNPPPGGGRSNSSALPVRPAPLRLPVLTAVAPSAVEAGATNTEFTLAGTGFAPQSQVMVGDDVLLQSIFVSSTQLKVVVPAKQIEVGGLLQLRVNNPAPGGGLSESLRVEIRYPVPTVTALATPTVEAGSAGLTLTVRGTGFFPGTLVFVASSPRPVEFVSSTELRFSLTEVFLREAGSYTVRVRNGAPGGGDSEQVTLTMVNASPRITCLPSRGGTSGGAAFELHVHGSRFVATSQVLWNGAPLPTTYRNSRRLTASVSSDAVAAPGVALISVSSASPGGGVSNAMPFTIRALRPQRGVQRTLELGFGDIAWDSVSRRLYLTSPRATSPYPDGVVAVDPLTARITGAVTVGSHPGRLAVSPDGRALFVGVDSLNGLRRLALPSLAPGPPWSLGRSRIAGDIEVLPGPTEVVASSRVTVSPNGRASQGVHIHENGVLRPDIVSERYFFPFVRGGFQMTTLAAPDSLYACSSFSCDVIGIDGGGAWKARTIVRDVVAPFLDIVGAGGRIYTTAGQVVDPEWPGLLTSFPRDATSLVVDPETGRIFFLMQDGIDVFDLNTHRQLGRIPIPQPSTFLTGFPATRMVRWGNDGLAFFTLANLIILQDDLVRP